MRRIKDFQTQNPDYLIKNLSSEDHGSLQCLLEKCCDYYLMVDGENASPQAADEIYNSAPIGRSIEDKFLFGIWQQTDRLVGVLEGMKNYPTGMVWWIGLLLLDPTARGYGLGRVVVEDFVRYVGSNQGKSIMLGVVEDNLKGLKFWLEQGFILLRETEPRRFGQKSQKVTILQKVIERSSRI